MINSKLLKPVLGIVLITAGLLFFFPKHKTEMMWESFEPHKLDEAKQAGQPVIMDFFADWCIPCHELDQFTYSDEKVMEALQLFKKIKVDATDPDRPETAEILEAFDIIGVPTVLFLDTDGREIKEARITGFVPPKELIAIVHSPRFHEWIPEKLEA